MSNRVEQYDLISKEAVEVVKETTSALIKTLDSMKDLVSAGVDLNKAFGSGAKGLGDTVKATKQVTDNTNLFVQTSKELEAQQAKLVAAQAKQIAAQSQAAQETRKATALTSEQIKISKLQAIVNDENAGKLEKLRAANGLLRIQKEKLKSTDENYVKTMAELNAQMDANNEAIKETHNAQQKQATNIGNYRQSLEGLKTQLINGEIGLKVFASGVANVGKGLLSFMLGPVGLVIGALAGMALLVGKTIKQAREFQAANAELAGVLGVSRKEMRDLKEEAKRLGATTAFSALEVTQLQTEFARLGLSKKDIKDVTESAINLSIAAKASTADTAAFVGSAINQFGLTADEAARITDVAAKSYNTTALSFEKLKTGYEKAAPAAAAYGDSIETTTAKLGVLANAGISAEVSGTSLKAMYLELADSGMSWDDAMAKINGSTNKLSTANQLFGKNFAVSALVLAENNDQVKELTKTYEGAEGATKKLADEQLDTLDGSIKILESSWSGFLFALEDGDGLMMKIARHFVDIGTIILTIFTKVLTGIKTAFDFVAFVFTDIKEAISPTIERIQAFGTLVKVQIIDRLQPLIDMIAKVKEGFKNLFSAKDANSDATLVGKAFGKVGDLFRKGKKYVAKFVDSRKEVEEAKTASDETKKVSEETQKELLEAKAAADEKRKEAAKKAAEELKKIEEARAEAELNAANRVYESRKMLIEQTVFNEFEKARQINAIDQEQINYSISLLEQKLLKEKAGSAEAIKLADEIAAKKFEIEKKAVDAAKITADENKKLFEEADAMLAEQVKFEQEQIDKKMSDLEDYYAEQAWLQRENIGLFSTNAKEREKQESELAVKLLELQRAQLSEQLRLGDLSVEAERNAKQQILDIDQQLADKKMANLEKEAEKRKEVTQMSLDLASQGFDTISGIYDMQNARLDAQHEIDLARTEEGSEGRILAEAKYDKEKRKLARKQAVLDRAQGLFNIGVSTATAIMNALAQFGPIAGAIFAGIIGAMGAAQIATVLATPLPAYKDGGVVPFDQIARVSEEGQELMISPSGQIGLTPLNESIMSLEKGTRIVPHSDTMKLLASQAYANIAIESNRSNKILEQIRDKSPEFVADGYKYVTKKGIKGRYKL